MWSVGNMLSRFSPGFDREGAVPLDVRKEFSKRALIKRYENSDLDRILSDKYCRGVALSKREWADVIASLIVENPSKRMKLDAKNGHTRNGILARVRELVNKHADREEGDLLVLKESDSAYENFVRDVMFNTSGFSFQLTRVAKFTEKGTTVHDVLKPLGPAMRLNSSDKIVVFRMDQGASNAFPSTDSDGEGYPFPGYTFAIANVRSMQEMIKVAHSAEFPIRTVFHESSEFHAYANMLCCGMNSDSCSSEDLPSVKPLSSSSNEELVRLNEIGSGQCASSPIAVAERHFACVRFEQANQTGWAQWDILDEEHEIMHRMENEHEFELVRKSKMENSKKPFIKKPDSFPELPSGFDDSSELVFFEIEQLENANVVQSRAFPALDGCFSPLQEALMFSKDLCDPEVTCDGRVLIKKETYAWSSLHRIFVDLKHPNVPDMLKIKRWIGDMLEVTKKGDEKRAELKAIEKRKIAAEQRRLSNSLFVQNLGPSTSTVRELEIANLVALNNLQIPGSPSRPILTENRPDRMSRENNLMDLTEYSGDTCDKEKVQTYFQGELDCDRHGSSSLL
ncbi:unnamed protein product [Oikopleura dioica]|uniref:Uncharacterized protein n=1 Tax=Oikopleura dioica TaxID=34765 RepID=E4WYA1_OIKDI|nr:unnamed protein product [Oikopleura dioica]